MSAVTPCSILKIRDRDDIDDRHGGCGVVVGGQLYLWGGQFLKAPIQWGVGTCSVFLFYGDQPLIIAIVVLHTSEQVCVGSGARD